MSLAESNARELELAIKEKAELTSKLSTADSKIAELSAALELAKKKKEQAESRHIDEIYAAQVQLCNAYVDIEVLKRGTTVIGQLACSVSRAQEGRRMLDLARKDMFNYINTGKLMAAD